MHAPSNVPALRPIPELVEPRVQPVPGTPNGTAADSAEVILRLAHDRDRIAAGMNDTVVRRLFAAGLALESALGLMGDHAGTGKVQEAIGELDLAIRDLRNVLFNRNQPDPHSDGRLG